MGKSTSVATATTEKVTEETAKVIEKKQAPCFLESNHKSYSPSNEVRWLPVSALIPFGVNKVRAGYHDDNNSKELRGSLAVSGWRDDLSVIKVFKLESTEIKRAWNQAHVDLGKLEALTEAVAILITEDAENPRTEKVLATDRVRAFKRLYCDENGSIIQPTYQIVGGWHRLLSVPIANAYRFFNNLPEMLSVPVRVISRPTPTELLDLMIADNHDRNIGVNATNMKDRCCISRELLGLGVLETQFRKRFGSVGQKLFAIAKADKLFPQLHVIAGITDGRFKFADIDKELISKPFRTEQKTGKVPPLPPQDEMLTILNGKDRTNKAKIMPTKNIVSWQQNSPVKLVKLVLSNVMKNDNSEFQNLDEKSLEELNKVYENIFGGTIKTS